MPIKLITQINKQKAIYLENKIYICKENNKEIERGKDFEKLYLKYCNKE